MKHNDKKKVIWFGSKPPRAEDKKALQSEGMAIVCIHTDAYYKRDDKNIPAPRKVSTSSSVKKLADTHGTNTIITPVSLKILNRIWGKGAQQLGDYSMIIL